MQWRSEDEDSIERLLLFAGVLFRWQRGERPGGLYLNLCDPCDGTGCMPKAIFQASIKGRGEKLQPLPDVCGGRITGERKKMFPEQHAYEDAGEALREVLSRVKRGEVSPEAYHAASNAFQQAENTLFAWAKTMLAPDNATVDHPILDCLAGGPARERSEVIRAAMQIRPEPDVLL